ncbi:MAG: MCP four helix bundle domain-containing protein [Clostridiaceae bacterium]
MLKRFYNIKISRSTLFLSILAITFNLLVGLVSYHSLNTINNNTNLMYSKSVKQLDVITGIRGAFANIRLNATRCLYKFDPKYNSEITKNDVIIQDYFDDFSSLTLNENEAANVKSLKSTYADYLSLWNTSYSNLKN